MLWLPLLLLLLPDEPLSLADDELLVFDEDELLLELLCDRDPDDEDDDELDGEFLLDEPLSSELLLRLGIRTSNGCHSERAEFSRYGEPSSPYITLLHPRQHPVIGEHFTGFKP